jgi:hypothetical protein
MGTSKWLFGWAQKVQHQKSLLSHPPNILTVSKNKKALPFLRTGLVFYPPFESPTGFCPTISETQRDYNN